jgi:iron complex outermembrane receptor protein
MHIGVRVLVIAIGVGVCSPAWAQTKERKPQELKRLTIEELAEVDITSVSRRSERLSDTPAAVSVITDEDVRRHGVTMLAEAMRLADALDVARIHGNSWAISARGFTITTANKLLVLIDGRSAYSPLFSGTFWDAQDFLVADIDRIEVIRGPGGATWGANAVNGVINVITKPAAATRGTFVMLNAGSVEHLTAAIRHGGRLGTVGSYRVYTNFADRGAHFLASGQGSEDSVRRGQVGFRMDSSLTGVNRWSLQGDFYRAAEGLLSNDDADVAGGNLMARWSRVRGNGSEFQAQVYYDRTFRHIPGQFEETRDTVDIEALHRQQFGRHTVVAGGNFRVTEGEDIGSAGFFFDPVDRTDKLAGVFVQDEIAVRPDRVFVTLGSKFERNDFTGLEVQPTIRVRVTPRPRHTAWGAISRAVRLPTRFDTDLRLVNPTSRAITLTGSGNFDAESVVAYEAGYRLRPFSRVALDAAVFRNQYDNLRSQELPAAIGQPIVLANLLNARTSGIELAATVQPAHTWRVHASYAFLHRDFFVDPGSRDPFEGAFEANDPSHLFSLRSWLDLGKGVEFDGLLRAAGERPTPVVPAYAELDLRLGWTVRPGWELSVVGQNLLHARHSELFSTGPRFALRRGGYLRSTWRF